MSFRPQTRCLGPGSVLMRTPAVIAVLAVLAGTVPNTAQGRTFHVSTRGDDNNPGTQRQPFATLTRARAAVRAEAKLGLQEDITVLLYGGTYELNEPLVFGPEDSGTDRFSITYAAAPGQKPVISGGRRVRGWKKGADGIWTVEIPAVKAGNWYFRQLFVNGRRATRARTPDQGADPAVWRLLGASAEGLSLAPGQLRTWRNLADVEVVVLGNWEITRKRLTSVDEATGSAAYAPPNMVHHPILRPKAGMACFVENARELLDSPGEWYLDRQTGTLSYWLLPGEDMATAQVVAPVLPVLLRISGKAESLVRNLHFKGLVFAFTDWSPPAIGYNGVQACWFALRTWEDDSQFQMEQVGEAIGWEFATSCSLQDGEVCHLGGTALRLMRGCSHNVVAGNHFFDVAANGVMVGEDLEIRNKAWSGTEKTVMQDGIPRRDWSGGGAVVLSEVPQGNCIANNLVESCGAAYYGAVGIWVGFTDGTVVKHNVVHGLPYGGISVGWQWGTEPTCCRNNLIEHNHIFDVMKMLADSGGIYTLGFQPGTVLRGNLIHDVHRSPFAFGGAPNNGIFLDEGSKGFLVDGNVIYNTTGEAVRFNQCSKDWHTWRDNSFGVKPDEPGFPTEAAAKAGLDPEYKARFSAPPKTSRKQGIGRPLSRFAHEGILYTMLNDIGAAVAAPQTVTSTRNQ